MGGLRSRCLEWALAVSKHGGSWWMPLALLGVCILNSLTGGVFVAVLGVLQSALFGVVVMSRRRSFILGPVALCLGGLVAACAHVRLLRAGGAEALLRGASESGAGAGSGQGWVVRGQAWVKGYGGPGLAMMSLTPAPTAVVVAAGVLAGIPESTILASIFCSRFVVLTLGAVGLRHATENMTPEDYIRQVMGGEQPAVPGKDD